MTRPIISVVIPCRNERRSLAACLDALLAQDIPAHRYEILVVDGRSTDGCDELAIARGVRLIDEGKGKGEGPAAARNLGIRESRGDIVAFTDADCVPARDWLASVLDVFGEKPALAGVAGALRMPTRTLIGRLEDLDAHANYRGVITSNVAYRRRVLLDVGGFDERLLCAEDYDLAWRLIDAGHLIIHDPRPRVLHDPPEVSGTLPEYLAKQMWYARHDVPAHALAVRRALRPGAVGSRSALSGIRSSLQNVALTLTLAAGFASPSIGALALGVTAARAVVRVRGMGARGREMPAMASVAALATLARGVGTLLGGAELARPGNWLALTPAERAALPAPRAAMERAQRAPSAIS